MYKQLFILILTYFVFSAPASASQAICGPDFNVTWAYCDFAPLIKAGENDAIINLVWDRMDERTVGNETYYYVGYVGNYYFYFRDGELCYMTNVTGGYELRYVYHNDRWYIGEYAENTTFYLLEPEKPCLRKVTWLSPSIVKALRNATLKSESYPVQINGSMLHISNGERSYSVKLPKNFTLSNLNGNVTLSAVFLKNGVLIYAQPKSARVPFGWNDIKVFHYDERSLKPLNFTETLKRRLPVCNPNQMDTLSMEKSQNQSTSLNATNQTETNKKEVCGTGTLLLLMIGPLILKKR